MPASVPQFDAAYDYVARRLHAELPATLAYHGPRHTLNDVLPAAERLAELSQVSEPDRLLLRTAALYHDIGYIEQYQRNEPIAARIAAETLGGFGYSAQQIEAIQSVILATQLPQQPRDLLQQIVCDADLDALGREDFYMTSFSLRLELSSYGDTVSLREWFERQLVFLENHAYFTEAARTLRNPMKQSHIQDIKQLLDSA